jgi:hypothetical protein
MDELLEILEDRNSGIWDAKREQGFCRGGKKVMRRYRDRK